MNKPTRSTLALALCFTLALCSLSPAVHAHGDAKPQHGGLVQMASDLSFELVAQGKSTALYVVDHGKPAQASQFSGKLTVLKGSTKTQADLKPVGGNKLEAAVTLEKGAKAVATLKLPNGKSTAVRFAIK